MYLTTESTESKIITSVRRCESSESLAVPITRVELMSALARLTAAVLMSSSPQQQVRAACSQGRPATPLPTNRCIDHGVSLLDHPDNQLTSCSTWRRDRACVGVMRTKLA